MQGLVALGKDSVLDPKAVGTHWSSFPVTGLGLPAGWGAGAGRGRSGAEVPVGAEIIFRGRETGVWEDERS